MNALTSHLLLSVLVLFLAERILHLSKMPVDTKRQWEVLLLMLTGVYIILGLFFRLP